MSLLRLTTPLSFREVHVKRHIFLACVCVLLVTSGLGQTPDASPTVVSEERELNYSEPLTLPMPMKSVQAPLTVSSENQRSNILSGGFQLGSAFNDNVLATPGYHVSNVSYLVIPRIEIRQTRERWGLDLAYSPALTVNQQLSEQNQTAHDLGLLLNYRLSPHVNLQLRDNFVRTNNLFSGLLGDNISPGPIQQPNPSLFVPLTDSTTNSSGADLTYRFGANSLVSAAGNYYFVNYGKVTGGSGAQYLIDSRSASATSSIAHRFSNRHWLGMSYGFQQLMFDPGSRTTVQRALLFYSYAMGSHMSLSFWAGPQYSTTHGNSVVVTGSGDVLSYAGSSKWSPGGGAQLEWQGSHTAFRAGYLRQISDGGGLAEAVITQQVDVQLQRQLGTRWSATTEVGYATNHPLQRNPLSADFNSLRGNAGIEYKLTESVGLSLFYGRQQQRYEYPIFPTALSNQNRVWFTLAYYFTRPLGR